MNDADLDNALKTLAEYEEFKTLLTGKNMELSDDELMFVSAAGNICGDYKCFLEMLKKR